MKLLYTGKKKPLNLRLPWLHGQYIFGDDPVEVEKRDAKWILNESPQAFSLVGENEPVFPGSEDGEWLGIEEDPAPEETADMVCPTCGKEYKNKIFFDRHVAKCTGEDE